MKIKSAQLCIMTLLLILYTSCTKSDEPQVDEVTLMIEEVRESTDAYTDHNTALNSGWNTEMSPCVEHPTEGGMGIHFGRMEYFDGRVNHLEPQILLYLPDGNGGMEFLGVEYVVPFAILPETEPAPKLFGQHFHQNHEQGIWALHVWTEKENPKGMFYDWNPSVSCD